MKKRAWIGTIVSVTAFLAFNPFAWADSLPAYTTESLVGVYKDEFTVIDPNDGSHRSYDFEDLDRVEAATFDGEHLVVYDKHDGWGRISSDGTYEDIDFEGKKIRTDDLAYGDGYVLAVNKKDLDVMAYDAEGATLEYSTTLDTGKKKVESVAYDNGYLYYAYKDKGKIKIDVTYVESDGTMSEPKTYETDDKKVYGMTIGDGQLYYATRDKGKTILHSVDLGDDGTFGEHHAFRTSIKKLSDLAYIPVVDEDHGGDGGGVPVPEPGTLLLIGSGLVGLGVGARRRSHRK